METKVITLTIGEQIDRFRDGRTQKWMVSRLNEAGIEITEVQFSNKKNGSSFENEELKALSKILGVKLYQN